MIQPEASGAPPAMEVINNPDGAGSILTGVPIGSAENAVNAENLKSWVAAPEGAAVEVLGPGGTPASAKTPVGTGMVVQVFGEDGTVLQSTTVVVKGDVLGTGKMSLSQLVRMASAYSDRDPLEGAYMQAADLNGDGGVTLTDLVLEARMFTAIGS